MIRDMAGGGLGVEVTLSGGSGAGVGASPFNASIAVHGAQG